MVLKPCTAYRVATHLLYPLCHHIQHMGGKNRHYILRISTRHSACTNPAAKLILFFDICKKNLHI